MATYKAKMAFRIKGFKRFWAEFKRCKRGVVGITFICLYAVLGVFGPILSPHDALSPSLLGYYPAGKAPIANELAVPTWYRYLPGGGDLSENMKVVSDHEFSSEEAMKAWHWETNAPNLANLRYNPVKGDRNDGAIEALYRREAADVPPKKAYIKITHKFTYPYKRSPKLFWIHVSYLVDGTLSADSAVTIEFLFRRIQKPPPLVNYTYPLVSHEDSSVIYTYPLHAETIIRPSMGWTHTWIRSNKETILRDPKYWLKPEATIFPTSGDYTYEIRIGFEDKGGKGKDITVYLDNLDIILYGEVYGILGTDGRKGSPRDIATSLAYGARLSIFIGLLAAVISVSLGLFIGLTSGYIGGATDETLMRTTDILMSLPWLPLVIVLMVVLGSSLWNVILILSLLGWMSFSRNVRSMALSLRERAFIEAAKAAGAGKFRIIFRHILPNVFALVYLALAVSVPGIIVTESYLSFLGLYDPWQLSWGRMFFEFSQSGVAVTKGIGEYWFWVVPPGMAISVLAISFILVGYSLDEILNPKLRVRR
ncbi:MAG: dipeptide transporter [Candidatus Bathyarchaeota archaeon BA1]|nr:MAG: dipeptide transporter [Candidatus Bathyarchaeota archaeon BA1]